MLAICIVIFTISVNFIIQKEIQDAESKKANDNLVKIVTKKAEREDEEIENQEKENEEIQNEEKKEDEEERIEIEKQQSNVEQIKFEKQADNIKREPSEETKKQTKEKIDWNKLNAINKDIIGWIEIPNTNINYPILKDQNLYYLNHNYERKANRNGSIFIRNNDLFESEEITIYGHNMKNGTMFAKLANYINKSFLTNNSKFYIYTKENTYEGHIFSAYSKSVNEEKEAIKSLNFDEKIKYYKNEGESLVKLENKVDKIVKLTTCSYINARTRPTEQRYYVIAEIKKMN